MQNPQPVFPPLISGHRLDPTINPVSHACCQAREGHLQAGDLVWSEHSSRLRFALVLEPEVERRRCGEMLYVTMVAFGDAAGALVAPEIGITYIWPNRILMNDGEIGTTELVVSQSETDGVPDWLVLGLDVKLLPDVEDQNPGERVHETTMWDEGCADLSHRQLLESTARHLLNAIYNWSEDGFGPTHRQWMERHSKNKKNVAGLIDNAVFIGLDENGNALFKGGETTMLETLETLATTSALCR